ncbi:MAG: RCC1 domain-containing protein, partial [Myxococcota bacterium]|nr:RCC1 domain-containing protein [Myxococcota bacterium]
MTGMGRWACVFGMWMCASCGGESESSGTSSGGTTSATTSATSATNAPPPILPQVCTGDEHTCVMKASGEVFCAGRNLDG